jgi:nucleobase:cation symporter-1, NCS1 family
MKKPDNLFVVERRSIDIIPDQERHGRPLSQCTLWLSANLTMTSIVSGALAVVAGEGALWPIIGLLTGNLLGGIVMALHSAQGPRLGLPQMISSRAQFGVYGAAIPLLVVLVMYIGYAASSAVLAGQAIAGLAHVGITSGIVIFSVITGVIAVVGYRMIHVLGRIASVVSVLAFLYLAFRLLQDTSSRMIFGVRPTTVPMFLLAVSVSAAYQLEFAPYVADYSRYLPRSTSRWATFWSTYAGSVIGCQLAMSVGAVIATTAGSAFAKNQVGYVVGLAGAGIVAAAFYIVVILGKLTINVLNTYGGFMSTVTIVSSVRGQVRIGWKGRATYVAAMLILSGTLAILGRNNFLPELLSFLLFALTSLIPWSAVNLIDYYFISKERYDIPALADPHGRYGRWAWRALVCYFLGVLVQIPFLTTSLYTGPLAAALGGTDVSWIIGLGFTAILYYLLRRSDTKVIPDSLIVPAGVLDIGGLPEAGAVTSRRGAPIAADRLPGELPATEGSES